MRYSHFGRPVAALGSLAILWIAASCSADAFLAPFASRISICHVSGATGQIMSVSPSEARTHLSQGDYPVAYRVTTHGVVANDSLTFRRIGDALAVVRAGRLARGEGQSARCRITIAVESGVYHGAVSDTTDSTLERFPMIVDVPDITLLGALALPRDQYGVPVSAGNGAAGATGTTLAPVAPLQFLGGNSSQTSASTPIIIANSHPGGSSGSGLWVMGFVFRSGHDGVDTLNGGQGVSSMRVDSLLIQGNRFEPGFSESIDLRASSAAIDGNFLTGTGGTCDICVAGPGAYRVSGNRLLAGGIPGILIVPALLLPVWSDVEQFTLPATSLVTAEVSNNEISDHLRVPVGTAIRVGAVGIGAPNVAGSARVVVDGNRLLNNTFGIIAEAAFPVANTVLRGDIDLTLSDNAISKSCQADLLVSFSRHTTALGLSHQPYLLNSTYKLTISPAMDPANIWYSNPDGYGNTLVLNGGTIPYGAQVPYVPGSTC